MTTSKPAFDRADASALTDDRGYKGALIRGQNPALLFEKGVRERITESYYWKEQCFGLNAATLCDRAAGLKFIGGTTGITGKPTPFLCLAFKLLQLVPEKSIILEYLNFRGDDEDEEGMDGDVVKKEEDANEDDDKDEKKEDLNAAGRLGQFKYLRCLAAFYIRLAWEPVEIYKTLEPLLTALERWVYAYAHRPVCGRSFDQGADFGDAALETAEQSESRGFGYVGAQRESIGW
jgi:pre-mRNA-splicing factor 38A